MKAIKPKFADDAAWQQANLLMQPALIRTIDNIRKYLEDEAMTWQGEYREFAVWPDDVPEETQGKIQLLQQELKTAMPEQVDAIQDALAAMPQPIPGYELVLTKADQAAPVVVDIIALCYRICFLNGDAVVNGGAVAAVDTGLIEDDTQEVDWTNLDAKTKAIVGEVFAALDRS